KGTGSGFGNAVEGLAVGAAEDDEVAGEQGDVIPRFIAVLSTTDAEDCFITDGQRHNRSERSFISILVHTHRGTRRIEVNQRHIGTKAIYPGWEFFGDIGSSLQSTVRYIQKVVWDWTNVCVGYAVHVTVG